jgi:ribonuclease P protein component
MGSAVARNRIKRVLRHAAQPYVDLLCGGHDIVIIARRALAGAEFLAVEHALTELFATSGLLRAGETASPVGEA